MKKLLLVLMLTCLICFVNSMNLQKDDKVTSLDASTVRSPGNFYNVSPDATEIITPSYADEKISVHMVSKRSKENCKGEKEKYTDRKIVRFNVSKNEVIKNDEATESFGTSSLPPPAKPDTKDVKPDDNQVKKADRGIQVVNNASSSDNSHSRDKDSRKSNDNSSNPGKSESKSNLKDNSNKKNI